MLRTGFSFFSSFGIKPVLRNVPSFAPAASAPQTSCFRRSRLYVRVQAKRLRRKFGAHNSPYQQFVLGGIIVFAVCGGVTWADVQLRRGFSFIPPPARPLYHCSCLLWHAFCCSCAYMVHGTKRANFALLAVAAGFLILPLLFTYAVACKTAGTYFGML